ncbi:MAG: hypothetical protein K2N38_12620, partial [Oscillospiraceae bacterium]|nr:hypothetical protein [Oscillospiraceae bacterium]
MAGSYDGSIRIDTAINAVPIDNGLAQIENKIKRMAATIGLAFGVKELINFGKRSIDAASDLAEAQNVVDTAFGDMSYKMEQFAATALETYGISELTAKNMGSTYMAMAKGMGVATDAASDMAVTLTGRLSDIMSFYNKTQSEVDTIGRALITGETEPLKAIGVVMTQTNLSAYALAQGFAKTYDEMSSNEQLLVRYKYFLEQTALAQDDFAKTSEGWANQTRLLSERINEFMTNLGSVIMNVLTPALQFANEAVTFLNDLFFGGKTEEETTAAKNAEAITDEVTSMGTAADKSKKKLNNLLSGFDELHIISGAKSDDEESVDAGIDTSNLLGVNLEKDAETASKASEKYRAVFEEIYTAIKNHPVTKTIVAVFDSIGEILGGVTGKKFNVSGFVNTLLNIFGAIMAYKTARTVISGIVTGFTTLKTIFTAVGSALGISGGLAALLVGVAVAIGVLAKATIDAKIKDHFGDIRLSFEQLEEMCAPLSKSYEEMANKFTEHRGKVEGLKDEFGELSDKMDTTLKKYEKLGEVSLDALPGFEKQIDECIDKVDELMNEQTNGAAQELENFFSLDGISEEEQAALDEMRGLGDTFEGKIATIKEQIHSITKKAAEESRGLLEAEIKNIRDLYDELEQYGRIKETAAANAAYDLLKTDMGKLQLDEDSYEMLIERIKEAEDSAVEAARTARSEAYKSVNEAAELKKLDGEPAAEVEQWLEKQYALIDKTYDDMLVDAAAKANGLRYRAIAGLAESIADYDGVLSIYGSDRPNPIDPNSNASGRNETRKKIQQLEEDASAVNERILNMASDTDRARERMADAGSKLIDEMIDEDVGTKLRELSLGLEIPLLDQFLRFSSWSVSDEDKEKLKKEADKNYIPFELRMSKRKPLAPAPPDDYKASGKECGEAFSEEFQNAASRPTEGGKIQLAPASLDDYKASGKESGEAWSAGFEEALNNSGNNFVMDN